MRYWAPRAPFSVRKTIFLSALHVRMYLCFYLYALMYGCAYDVIIIYCSILCISKGILVINIFKKSNTYTSSQDQTSMQKLHCLWIGPIHTCKNSAVWKLDFMNSIATYHHNCPIILLPTQVISTIKYYLKCSTTFKGLGYLEASLLDFIQENYGYVWLLGWKIWL